MSCPHKFQQYLSLERLDFEPTTLMVGTFNPAWPDGNQAEWFYGRTSKNYFWDVLPRLYGKSTLINSTHTEWKEFCNQNQIAITDLISCINDAEAGNPDHIRWLSNFSDKNIATKFNDHAFVAIDAILEQHPTIRNVYFTRGLSEGFWKKQWFPVQAYCAANNIRCTTLVTPSGYAYYQQGRWNKKNPNNKLELGDYILMRWQQVWH